MRTNNQFLTSICKQINDSSVTSLLNGGITKGSKRPDGISYPCLTVATNPAAVRENYAFQVFDSTITIFVGSNTNGTADTNSLSAIESALVSLLNVEAWSDAVVTCKSQLYQGTFGPFWDSNEADVHFQSVTFQSFII